MKLNLDYMLNYPTLGPSASQILEGGTDSSPIFYLGASKNGVLRALWVTLRPFAWLWADFLKARLRVYVGAGTVANPATATISASYLCLDLPLMQLCGVFNLAAMPEDRSPVRDTELWTAWFAFDTPMVNLEWRLPMPFENGIVVQVGQLDGSTWTPLDPCPVGAGVQTFSWATYEEGTNPIAGVRLKSSRAHGAVAGPANVTIASESVGFGVPVALFYYLKCPALAFENNWKLYTKYDGSKIWQSSGTEDIAGPEQSDYFTTGEAEKIDRAVYHYAAGPPVEVECYRSFKRIPLAWTDGGKLLYPVSAGQDLVASEITLIYYQQNIGGGDIDQGVPQMILPQSEGGDGVTVATAITASGGEDAVKLIRGKNLTLLADGPFQFRNSSGGAYISVTANQPFTVPAGPGSTALVTAAAGTRIALAYS